MNLKKPVGKIGTILIVIATVLLAGIAIFTAFRLYQLRDTTVAPNAPSSNPKADEASPASACTLSFTLSTSSPTPTGTSSATPTPTGSSTATPTPTPTTSGEPNSCGGTCGSNSNCTSGYYCYNGYCRNPSCPTNANCSCGSATPTATVASLPQSGTNWPTVGGIGLGILIIVGSILLAI